MIETISKQTFAQNTLEMSNNLLRREIKCFYADYFTQGNKNIAKISLQNRMKPYRQRDVINLSFNVLMLIMQLIVFIFLFIQSIRCFKYRI